MDRVSLASRERGISPQEFCIQAIKNELYRRPHSGLVDDVLAELWDNEDDAIFDELFPPTPRGSRTES
jgi:hypothetical protein